MKPWQKGYELEYLRGLEERWDGYNKHSLSPFSQMKKNSLANYLDKDMVVMEDNYSYIIKDNLSNDIIIIDPAESELILEKIKNKKLQLKAILLTHHHNDHTAGVNDILKFFSVPVYSPSKNILGTSSEVSNNDEIKTSFINFKVIILVI